MSSIQPPTVFIDWRPSAQGGPRTITSCFTCSPSVLSSILSATLILTTIQAMLKTLYDHFVVLYENILPTNPTLASEHALKQEEEVYAKSHKLTYRNVCAVLYPTSCARR